ncbi:hypothetical protein B5M42_023425 [Paenibacillus athensensis]|uniref:Uncharacterized protein n=1 Tax=Paenibacillus athensensis TaxID=1967502 RepID=A0A4Y8PTI0_9BACL|nr:DUF6179 domain-containing protein [Paenibacillus athensensis]MCD1261752.1 hypothetical protein [Paenibacillus athensensis]
MNADQTGAWPAVQSGKRLHPERLARGSYTVALLAEGQRAGRLGRTEALEAQSGLMRVLERLIRQRTKGESSSIAAETAESLLASILYATDLELRMAGEPERALERLRTEGIVRIHHCGVERVAGLFTDAKRLYGELRRSKLALPVDAYQLTIDESLPVFMKKYDVVFEAHNTMASIDYPLAADDTSLTGITYIHQYMERLLLETRLVGLFPLEDVLGLLADYGDVCRFDYRIELFNIFELVLEMALFSLLSGGSARELRLAPERLPGIKLRLAAWDLSTIRAWINRAQEELCREWALSDPQWLAYMRLGESNLAQRLHHAVRHDSLEAVVITTRAPRSKPETMSFGAADRMSDMQLRKRLEQLADCASAEAKIKLIQANFRSLHDYLDMLEADILYGAEYETLFAAFGDTELAVLAKITLYEELRGSSSDLLAAVHAKRSAEAEWQQRLLDFLNGLSARRLAAIGERLETLDVGEFSFR